MVELFVNSGDPDQTHVLPHVSALFANSPFLGSPDYNGLTLSMKSLRKL